MSLTALQRLLNRWRSDPTVGGNIELWHEQPARPAHLQPFPTDVHPRLAEALANQGIHELYSHQVQSWETLHAGEHVIVATGTASGKSLCYDLPVLNAVLQDPESRALFVFPTKALAQDQASSLKKLLLALPELGSAASRANPRGDSRSAQATSPLAIYDGDTPLHNRPAIRGQVRLLFSNPDMLHLGILPHHTSWAEFLRHLSFVVIDEAHLYRGVFGSHVANVLRRLRRLAAFYGSYPQFILTSATIANPRELAEKLVEAPVTLVNQEGSSRGAQTFLIYNPPVVNPDLGLRRNPLQEAVRLTQDLFL
jgi:DEAD/DEAH box helicase domain-containing protein